MIFDIFRKKASGVPAAAALVDLLNSDVSIEERDGVYIDSQWDPVGVSEQFIEDADTYHQRYFARVDFRELIDRCLSMVKIDRSQALQVLDIGSGGGSSVFALCEVLPSARVIATDLSPQLLKLLSDFAATRGELKGRITTCCFDLQVPFFKRDCFDLVVGTAILHHLADPAKALRNVVAALKPGRSLVLVEPLEAGSLMLTILFEKVLLALKKLGQEEGAMAELMRAMRLDIQARLGVPVLKPWTAALDDKWVFDEPYLQSLAVELGLSSIEIHPSHTNLERVFETCFRSLLSESGNAGLEIPASVLEVIQAFDQGISPLLKQQLSPTGILVFRK